MPLPHFSIGQRPHIRSLHFPDHSLASHVLTQERDDIFDANQNGAARSICECDDRLENAIGRGKVTFKFQRFAFRASEYSSQVHSKRSTRKFGCNQYFRVGEEIR